MTHPAPEHDENGAPFSLKIGDLARRAGKSPRALRLYEDLGLLGPDVRTEGGHRLYAEEALVRLSWIDKLQLLGLSLQEIRGFLDVVEGADGGPAAMSQVRGTFHDRLFEVRRQIDGLRTLERELVDSLEYLDACGGCSTAGHLVECKACGEPHSTEAPVLITGIHVRGEGN